MARFAASIDLPLTPDEAFDVLADFSRTIEWDPSVVESAVLTTGSPRVGSRFRVVVGFLGRRLPLDYEITAYERPTRLVLEADDGTLRSIDTISIEERRRGSRVHYEARVELAGVRRLADPLLHLLFQQTGKRAARGLAHRFARRRSRGKARNATRSRPGGRGSTRRLDREGVSK